MSNLKTTLDNMTRPELIGLIQSMLKIQPELMLLLLPAKSPQHDEMIRQARRDLSKGYCLDEWDQKALRFHQSGKPEVAASLYQIILEEVLPILMEIEEECEITETLQVSVSGWLASADQLKPGSPVREEALRGLFGVIQWDTNEGGLGLSDEILPWLDSLGAREGRLMLDRVEAAMAALNSGRSWERERWAEVARHLVTDEEELVDFLSEHQVTGALFKALVDRADFPAALQVAAQQLKADENQRPGLANILCESGQLEMARQLVREGPDHWANWHWLASHYSKPKERALALECCLRCWALRQDLNTYYQIAHLSKALKTWPQVGPQLLREVPQDWLRVQILTEEKAFAEAWELADRLPGGEPILRQLAQRSAAQFPIRAAQALLAMARARVERGQNRSAYREAGPWVRQAVGYLEKAPAQQRDRLMEPWQEIYRRFPALQDEWQQMGLSRGLLFP